MKKLFFSVIIFTLTACSNIPKNPETWMELKKNACLPTAIAFKQGLNRQEVWAKVLRYTYADKNKGGKTSGHAVTAYMYPAGKNQLWTYDYLGSYKIKAYKDQPWQVARESVRARGQWHLSVETAEYLD